MSSDTGNGRGRSDAEFARLVRAGADNELTPVEQQALDAHLQRKPRDAARLEFERGLKSAVGRSMTTAYPTPPGLRERVQAAIRASEEVAERDETEPAPVVQTLVSQTRTRSFWASTPGRVMAAAAAIALAVGVWYVIRDGTRSPAFTEPGGRVQLASFLSREHRFCDEDSDFAKRKLICQEPSQLSESCEAWIGRGVALAHLFDGPAKLVGMGPCGVPGPGRSVHLQMVVDAGAASQATVSLFIQEGSAGEGVDFDQVYDLKEASGDGVTITVWRDSSTGLVFYLVCDDETASTTARRLLDVTSPTQSL